MTSKEYLMQIYNLDHKIYMMQLEADEYRRLADVIPGGNYDKPFVKPSNRNTEAPFVKWINKALDKEKEIEMEIERPYVLECGVSAAPDPIRGQVVKASIVLTKGTEGTEELKKEIQNYVKKHTAPYKYPRIVEFRTELPKTVSGKIIRSQL